MLCERILRNLPEFEATAAEALSAPKVDFVDLHWKQCQRIVKATSHHGREVRVVLPPGQSVRHGDVLYEDPGEMVIVNIKPCEVIVVRLDTIPMAAAVALEVGNLHLPVSVGSVDLCFPPDDEAIRIIEELGASWTQEVRRFEPRSIRAIVVVDVARDFQLLRTKAS